MRQPARVPTTGMVRTQPLTIHLKNTEDVSIRFEVANSETLRYVRNSFPVDSSKVTIAEAHANRAPCNAHGGRNGETILRRENDSEGGPHLHARSAGWRVVGELVAEDAHNVCMDE